MTSPVRLALLAASPVYYQAPLYRRLAADPRIDFTAIFASSEGVRPHDGGYGRRVKWDVDVLDGYRSVFLRKADSNVVRGSFLALRDLDVVPLLARGGYDVLWLHGYNFLTHTLAAATQLALRRGLLFREDQTLLHPRALWKRMLKEPGLRLLFRSGRALYVGTENRRWFEHYGVRESRLFFTPYAVDTERLERAAAELAPQRDRLRADFGIRPGSGPVIVTVSRLIAKKQPLFLLEGFRRLRARVECTLLVVGCGELEGEMRRKVADERIPDVVFAGSLNQTEVARAYACADVFCLASREHETWGLVVNEAMAFGLPVVVSDKVGSAADLVRHGENGFVFDHREPDELARYLGRLVEDAAARRTFGERSRELIAPRTAELSARGILAAVEAAVGPNRWAEAAA